MKVWLQALGTVEAPSEICLDQFPFVIGRRSDSDACLPFAFISRHHCQFIEQAGKVLVQDLESYNGTFVNGRSASLPMPVQDGDELTLGPLSFRVVMPRLTAETAEMATGGTRPEIAKLQ
jgi:pSer/pThr/pTyr-binding forkhead associated (FHA) protein